MHETNPTERISSAAERMRRHRQRQLAGRRCLLVELREPQIEMLIRTGLLKHETRHDRSEIIKALHAHFDRTLSPMP